MSITDKQNESMSTLVTLGFGVTHFYNDGIVRMALPNKVGVFIRPDGSVSEPHTIDTKIARVAMNEKGLTIR